MQQVNLRELQVADAAERAGAGLLFIIGRQERDGQVAAVAVAGTILKSDFMERVNLLPVDLHSLGVDTMGIVALPGHGLWAANLNRDPVLTSHNLAELRLAQVERAVESQNGSV